MDRVLYFCSLKPCNYELYELRFGINRAAILLCIWRLLTVSSNCAAGSNPEKWHYRKRLRRRQMLITPCKRSVWHAEGVPPPLNILLSFSSYLILYSHSSTVLEAGLFYLENRVKFAGLRHSGNALLNGAKKDTERQKTLKRDFMGKGETEPLNLPSLI